MIDILRLSLALACSWFSYAQIQAQIPISWSQNLGNAQKNIIVDVVDIPSEGCLTIGYSAQNANSQADLWIIRYSNDGTFVWSKNIGSAGFEKANAATMLSDGNFMLVGQGFLGDGLAEGASKATDGLIAKIDPSGNVLWTRTYGGLGFDTFKDIVAMPNGECLAVGTTSSYVIGYTERATNGWAVRINNNGGIVWDKKFGGSLMDSYSKVVRNTDGSFLLGGTSNSRDLQSPDSFGADDLWVTKINANGNHVWSRNYGGTKTDQLNSLAATSDNAYIIAATTYSALPGHKGNGDIWVLKISALGNQVWQKFIGGSATDKCTDIQPFEGDGFLLSGTSFSTNGDINSPLGGQDAWLGKLSDSGNLEWKTNLGGSKNDAINATTISPDGSVWLAGYSFSADGQLTANLGLQDGWLMRSNTEESPTVSLGGNVEICVGTEITLDASDANCATCTYLWNDASTLAVRTIIVQQSSTYSVTLTNSAGESSTDAVNITAIPMISTTVDIQEINCADTATGAINLTPTGGTGNYIYNWSNGKTDGNNPGLVANTYFVTISDEALCEYTASYTLTNPSPILVDADIELPSCTSSNLGAISLTVSGGVPSYQYTWSNGFIGPNISGLSPGKYTVSITDELACMHIESYLLSNDVQIDINPTLQDVSCFGGSDGTISLVVTADFPPLSFGWDNGFSASSLVGLSASEYTVTITDAMDCQLISKYTIAEPDPLDVFEEQNNTTLNESEGSILLNIVGGVPPYDVEWSNGEFGSLINNLAAGVYTAIITDANDCRIERSYEIEGTTAIASFQARELKVFPNPSLGLIYIQLPETLQSETSTIALYDMHGRLTGFQTGASAANQLFLKLNDYIPGLYIVNITDSMTTYQAKIVLQ